MAEAKITLAHKKNIKDNEARKAQHLAKLKAITGVDFEFVTEQPFEELVPRLIKAGDSWHASIGNTLYGSDSILSAIVYLFENSCKDEMIKEGLIDAISTNKIVVVALDEWPDKSKYIEFKDGKMIVNTVAKNFGGSASSCYATYDVSKVL